jgi:hypothetical protein
VSCNSIDPICAVVGSIGRLGSTVTTSVFSSVASDFGNTADSAINWLWQQMSTSSAISLGGANFELDLGIVASIAAVVCLGLFVIQMAMSALKHDAGGVGRALRGLVIATVGCAITLASLDVLLGAVDQLCAGVVKVATGGTVATLGAKIIAGTVFTEALASPPTILILSLVAICAVAIVWFALVIRKMLIIITAIFAPLAFAGGVAELSRGWVRKWLEAMLALVFSKLILIIIFVIGLGVLGGMGSPARATPLSAITDEITGLLILLVAGLSPWMALRIVHFTGDHVATMSASAGHASSGATAVVGAPQKMAQMKYAAATLGGGGSRSLAPPPGSGLGPLGSSESASPRASASAGAGAGAASAAATGGAMLAASAAAAAGRGVHAGARGVEQAATTGRSAVGGAGDSVGTERNANVTGRARGSESRPPSVSPTPHATPPPAEGLAGMPIAPLADQPAPQLSTPPAAPAAAPMAQSATAPPFPASPPQPRRDHQ